MYITNEIEAGTENGPLRKNRIANVHNQTWQKKEFGCSWMNTLTLNS